MFLMVYPNRLISFSLSSLEYSSKFKCFLLTSSVIRATVPKLNLDDVFEQKTHTTKAVASELEKAMSHYGFEIVETLIVFIEPDVHVKRAMNEINAAARMRLAANEKSEAEKIIQIKRAEEVESKYPSKMGIARHKDKQLSMVLEIVCLASQLMSLVLLPRMLWTWYLSPSTMTP